MNEREMTSEYDPVKCLREEVERFKRTNKFTPMLVTGFYLQAAVVLDEHARLTAEIASLRSQLLTFSTHEKSFIADRERAFEQELEGLREDRETLDWLLKYITQNGAKGIEAMDWHVLKDDDGDFSDRSEIVFDRTAIRQAMKETK